MKYWSAVIGSVLVLVACQQSDNLLKHSSVEYSRINGETMGTTYNIRYQLPEGLESQKIQAEIDQRLVEFNNSLSTWQKDSTISKFNKSSDNSPMVIEADFIKVFNDSKLVYQQSMGAFDPTVKPILDLWGFGTEMRVDRLQSPPNQQDINRTKELVDFDSIILEGDSLSKGKEGIAIDFSAIAKGYGVDVIADILKNKYKINNYMVEIGGEVATSGINNQGKGWTIAIDAPILHSGITDRKLIATIQTPIDENQQGGMHLATSGNYRNSIVFDGVRYSHTIDPTTGKPIVNGASSVTVADESVALADAWATALTAMPYEQALKTAQSLDKAVMFIVLKENIDKDKESHSVEDWKIVETENMKALRAGKNI